MADFVQAVQLTLQHEGGFQKDSNDRANWTSGTVGVGTLVGTKYGITTLDMPGVDIENITPAQATAYYLEHYWKTLYSQIASQLMANKLFDLGVLFGVGTAVKILQGVLGLPVDGDFGPQTLASLNQETSSTAASILFTYKTRFHAHAAEVASMNPLEAPDRPDWDRRIDS